MSRKKTSHGKDETTLRVNSEVCSAVFGIWSYALKRKVPCAVDEIHLRSAFHGSVVTDSHTDIEAKTLGIGKQLYRGVLGKDACDQTEDRAGARSINRQGSNGAQPCGISAISEEIADKKKLAGGFRSHRQRLRGGKPTRRKGRNSKRRSRNFGERPRGWIDLEHRDVVAGGV